MEVTIQLLNNNPKDVEKLLKIMENVGWGKFRGTAEDYLKRLNEEPSRRIYLAKLGTAVIGFGEVVLRASKSWAVPERAAYLYAVAIEPRYAKNGAAKQFVALVFEQLEAMGYLNVLADIRWDNSASLNLSSSLGAKIVGPAPEAIIHASGGQQHLRVEYAFA